MNFTREQLAAMFKLASTMASVDGKVTAEEIKLILLEAMANDDGSSHTVFTDADALQLDRVHDIIDGMTDDQQKYLCGFLAAVMQVDGEVDEKEELLWNLTAMVCRCPFLTVDEALDFWRNN